jgi:hypothetical protein
MPFQDTVYSSQFLLDLDRRTVARSITNDNYTVVGARSVEVYAADPLSANDKNADNSVQIQNPSGASTPMAMDQEKDLTVGIPSVEQFQTSVDMQRKFRDRQSQAGAEDVDDFVLAKHTDANITLSTTASTASGFGDVVRNAKVSLSDNNVPRSGRFMVVSPTYADLIAEDAGDRMRINSEIEAEGYIGRYQGFDIYESTGLPTDADSEFQIFGHREAITLAIQLEEFNLVPNASQAVYHGDVLKGLMVYGANCFLPDALGSLDAALPS